MFLAGLILSVCAQGPCRREMDGLLNMLKISDRVNPRGFRIPNCDRKGFYRKKQVRDKNITSDF